jgi:uncharacterized protein YqjF (DUF2071 family)
MQQHWSDLLFLHWEIDPDTLRALIPPSLEIDTYDGKGWLGVVPFSMSGVAPRGSPKPSFICDFPEINVRTYVKRDGKPGIWFFSLDVPRRLPVWLARTFFHLPYFKAEMEVRNEGSDTYYKSTCRNRSFEATYRGRRAILPEEGSFERWATERYCLYSARNDGRLYRAEEQHPRWPLQQAEYSIRKNTMLDAFPIGEQHPSALFSKELPVVAWMVRKD